MYTVIVIIIRIGFYFRCELNSVLFIQHLSIRDIYGLLRGLPKYFGFGENMVLSKKRFDRIQPRIPSKIIFSIIHCCDS